MNNYKNMIEGIKQVISSLSFNKDEDRYEVSLKTLMGYIEHMRSNGILSWSDRDHHLFEQDPDGYVFNMFNGATVKGKPLHIEVA